MRKCVVCGLSAENWCGGCGNVSYCGVKHQKQDWTSHKNQCHPWRIAKSDQLGQYLVAGRDLDPGDVVLDDDVSVLGPADGDTRVCLGCYYPTHGYTCSTCGVPLCGPSCQLPSSPHIQECATIAKYQAGNKDIQQYITTLRFILLKQSDLTRYKKCRQLSTNLEMRKDQPDFEITKQKVSEFLEIFPDLASEETVLSVMCILDTNTFQVLAAGTAYNLAGLYPRPALLNHSCVPNCRLVFRSQYRLQVRTSVRVKKGESLFISYTPPFYTLIARNNILQRGKQFTCTCTRCTDTSELGTCLSSVLCDQCSDGGYYQHCQGLLSDWKCSACGHVISHQQYSNIDAQLLGIQSRFDKGNVEEMKYLLSKYSSKLTNKHGLILELKQHLAAAIGRVDGYRYDQISPEDSDLKINISYDLLEVLNILEPGYSKSRGITLLDLAECKARSILQQSNSDESDIYDQLLDLEEELSEAYRILQFEDEDAIEGNVAKKAKFELGQLRQHIFNFKKKMLV